MVEPLARVRYRSGADGPAVQRLPVEYLSKTTIKAFNRRNLQIGAGGSIVGNGDKVLNLRTRRIHEIDYFHGFHPLEIVGGRESVSPIAQMDDDDNCFAHKMIALDGPALKAIAAFQRRWRSQCQWLGSYKSLSGTSKLVKMLDCIENLLESLVQFGKSYSNLS